MTIHAKIIKPSKDSKIGITFEMIGLCPGIKKISYDSPFLDTYLEKEMSILAINDTNIMGKTLTEIISLIGDIEGELIFTADHRKLHELVVTFIKDTPKSKVGLVLTGSEMYPCVKKLLKASPLNTTGLKPGMIISSINDVDLKGKSLDECLGVISDAEKELVFVAYYQRKHMEDLAKGGIYINEDENIIVPREFIPDYLTVAGVTGKEWNKLYDLIEEMVPVFARAKLTQHAVRDLINGYWWEQNVTTQIIGFGTEAGHELKTFLSLEAESAAMNHLICLATNATTVANAMLSRHGVAVKMAIDKEYPFADKKATFSEDRMRFKKIFHTRPNGFEFLVV